MSRTSWFGPPPVPPPIEARAAAMGIPTEAMLNDGWCDACRRHRVLSEVERVTRAGVDLVICKDPRGCIAAATVAGLWKE